MTGRGFPDPTSLPERLAHEREIFVVVRLTEWERRFLSLGQGIEGKVTLVPRDRDGTFDLVCTAGPEGDGDG